MTKKPMPPLPSSVTVWPALNVRSFIDCAICLSSRSSRSEKSGTRLSSSTGASAMARSIDHQDAKIPAVTLTVVGCAPAWPNPRGAQSGDLVHGSGNPLLDCGPGVLARLRERDPWPRVDAIVITHFHLDHWGDLVPWVWGSMYLQGRGDAPQRAAVWVPPGGIEQLEQFGLRLGFPDMFERVFGVHEYAPGRPFVAAAHTVVATRVPHYRLDAHALRVTDGTRTVAYSGDSGPSAALEEAARDADLFVCEA